MFQIDLDNLWYDYQKINFDIDKTDKYISVEVDDVFMKTDTGFIVTLTGLISDDDSLNDYFVAEFDNNGSITNLIPITQSDCGLSSRGWLTFKSFSMKDGNPVLCVKGIDYDINAATFVEDISLVNINTGEVENLDYLKVVSDEKAELIDMGYIEGGYEYLIDRSFVFTDEYSIHFGKDGKYLQTVKLFDITQISYGEVGNPVLKDNVVVFSFDGGYSTKSLEVSLDDFSAELVDHNRNEFDEIDGYKYTLNEDGIYCGEIPVLPFDCSYVNASMVNGGRILYADGENFIIKSRIYINNNRFGDTCIFSFTRVESNPNVGKDVLVVGMIGDADPMICEAISRYNASSDKYFIKTKYYSVDTSETPQYSMNGNYTNEYEEVLLNKQDELVNELSIDIYSGEGPDIFIDTQEYLQLNNDDYLIDLSDFVNKELGDIELFDNIVDACKTGDRLYQMPLGFYVSGILTEISNVEVEKGFTFDEYIEYVDLVCNGKNPIGSHRSRLDVFNLCIASMADQFYDEDGNVTCTNDAFYEVAKYCLENIPEEYYGGEGDLGIDYGYVGYSLYGDALNQYVAMYGMSQYISAIGGLTNSVKLYGIPSIDGRGPGIKVTNSIAISAATSNEAAAKDFLKFILSTDDLYEFVNRCPVVVSACETLARRDVDSNNKEIEQLLIYNSEMQIKDWGLEYRDYSTIDDYMSIIRSADCIMGLDVSIKLIMIEEIPAYFAGQKSIEDVAKIIEDRAQTVIDERG